MSAVTPEFVKNLETAAEAALGNQGSISHEQRQKAEDVLLSFRRSNPSFQDCRILLENTIQDTVQYQAAAALKDSVIRQWKQTQECDRTTLQEFVLQFVINRPKISAFVREILTQILAVMIKLTTVQDQNPKLRESVYSFLTSLIGSGNTEQQLIACSITSALVTEFSITSKSSNMGVTWNQHLKCKQAYEDYDLKITFSLVLDVLKHANNFSNALSNDMVHVLLKILTIAEQLLNWTFTIPGLNSRRSTLLHAEKDKVNFRPHKDWESVILDAENIRLFFHLNLKCQSNENLSRISVSCLAQLASLHGPVVGSIEKKCFYLNLFVQEFLSAYGNGKFNDYEALGVAYVCKNLIESSKIEIWASTPQLRQIFEQFLLTLSELTCSAMAGAAKEEQLDIDDHLYMESFETFLDTWTTIIEALKGPKDFIIPHAMKIFEHYVKCHILPPDGTRSVINDSDHDIDEIEEDDRDRFAGQLLSIAYLARLSPQTSLVALSNLLENRLLMLRQNLVLVQSKSQVNEILLENLHEDLHWLILIAGHILADESDGETPLMPPELVKFSISQKQHIDQNLTLQLLGSPQKHLEIINSSPQSVDLVIRLTAVLFSLCDVINDASKLNLVESLSPEVVRDLVWFLEIWTKPYLFFKEEYYDELSPVMSAAFGPDSGGARWCVNYITKFVCVILHFWTSEPELLEGTADLLGVIVENDGRCSTVSSCEEFWKLGHSICAGDAKYGNHPPIIKQQVMSSIVVVGSSNMNLYKEKYWEQTMNIVAQRYRDITTQHVFGKSTQSTDTLDELLAVLDLLHGVAEAARSQNTLLVFNFLAQLLSDGSKLIQTCHSNQTVIISVLELFVMVAHGQICYLKESKCRLLYEWTLSVLQAFSVITKDFRSRDAEEESFQDLSLIIELLSHLLSRDFIDFSDPDLEAQTGLSLEDGGNCVSVSDVVLYGLGVILPHMNAELLAYPSLCCQYYKLVTFMCEIYPEKVEQLPLNIFNAFMFSLQIGVSSYGNDNCKLCLEAILGLTEQACNNRDTSSVLQIALLPFIKIVFDVILVHAGDMELLRTAGDTFYSMCRFKYQRVSELFTAVIEAQTDPQNKQKLISEFSKLSPQFNPEIKFDKKDKSKFINTLEAVIFGIRGILCVK